MIPVVVALVALAPAIGEAGHPHKGHATHANQGAKVAAAAEHKAMMQQHRASVQNQTANQHRAALAGSGVGTTHRHGTSSHVGTTHRGGSYSTHRQHTDSAAMVSSLHSVVSRLHQADHDYNGHRVQAIHQLDQAIQTLQGHIRGAGSGVFGIPPQAGLRTAGSTNQGNSRSIGTSNGGTHRMSQAESDGHLRQAHQQLMAVESRMAGGTGTGVNNGLSTGTSTGSSHHQQAHTHVRQALQHLNTALAVR